MTENKRESIKVFRKSTPQSYGWASRRPPWRILQLVDCSHQRFLTESLNDLLSDYHTPYVSMLMRSQRLFAPESIRLGFLFEHGMPLHEPALCCKFLQQFSPSRMPGARIVAKKMGPFAALQISHKSFLK